MLSSLLVSIGLNFNAQVQPKAKPAIDTTALYQTALNLSYQERFKEALPFFDTLIQLNAPIEQLYFDRGMLKKHLGNNQGAIEDFTAQIQKTPREADAYFLRGELLLAQGQYKAAYCDLTDVVRLDSANADAHCMLARAAQELGKTSKARKEKLACEQIKLNGH